MALSGTCGFNPVSGSAGVTFPFITMNHTITWVPRLIHDAYDSPARLRGVIGFCRATGIREVQLCPHKHWPAEPVWLPRRALVRRRRQLAGIIRTLGRNGIAGTLNVLRTFMPAGGGDAIGFRQPRMDAAGAVNPLMPCPRDPGYLDYIRFFYGEMAKTGASKIFVDDDFRFESLGLGPTCFCPLHIAEFNRRTGARETRESLARICADARPSARKRQWMEFKRDELLDLARLIRETVHAVAPQARVGLMLTYTEISLFEGRDIRRLVEAFAGGLRPLARPAQGWYSDETRLDLLAGLADTVFQASRLPPDSEIQAEIDSWPHSRFNKSAAASLEYQVSANLACGLKKQSLWVFDWRERVRAGHPYAALLRRSRKVLGRIARLIPDSAVLRGVHVAYSLETGLLRPQRSQDVALYGPKVPMLLWRLGVAFGFDGGEPWVLTRDSFPMSREALADCLERHSVLMDSEALQRADELGLAPLAGARVGKTPVGRGIEAILPHRINGRAAGQWGKIARCRDCRRLRVPGGSGTVLSRILDARGRVQSPGAVALIRKGRRRIVLAYPLEASPFYLDEIKQAHVQGMLGWLAGGCLPACVRGAPDVCPVVLADERTGVRMVSLVNASTARADGFTLTVALPRAAANYSACCIDEAGRPAELPARRLRGRPGGLDITVSGSAGVNPFQVRVFRLAPR